MDVIYPAIWKRIRRDKVKLRGSNRTKRLRKKRLKHWSELYEKYRDEMCMEHHGVTFLQRMAQLKQEKDNRFLAKFGMTYIKWREYKKAEKMAKAQVWSDKYATLTDRNDPNFKVFCDEYGKETADLMGVRTKNSPEETIFSVAKGVAREQLSKFNAIAKKLNFLNEDLFWNILHASCPQYRQWEISKDKKKSKPDEDVREYRKQKRR